MLQVGVLAAATEPIGEIGGDLRDARLQACSHVTQKAARLIPLAFGVGEGGQQDDRIADLARQTTAQSLLGLGPDEWLWPQRGGLGREGRRRECLRC